MGLKGRKNISIIMITLVLIFGIIFVWNSISDKETILDEVKLRENVKIPESLAIMLEKEDGSGYTESDSNSWPTTGYKFNSELSGCIDRSGNKLDGILTYNSTNNMAVVETGTTAYCYIYFDIIKTLSKLCESGDNLGSCITDNNEEIDSLNNNIEGGLYRYQGTNIDVDDNYICFGTSDKEECTGNTDAYMYRIIGINSSGQLKLIKKEALNTIDKWWSDYSTNKTWPETIVYGNINGSTFLSNSTYMPSGWSDKIADTSWKYGDNTNESQTASALYTTENGWTATTTAKIGLMYAHDYAYGMSGGNNCSSSGAYSTCKTSWLHLSNNDSGAPLTHEWTMSRYGYYGDTYYAWCVISDGYFNVGTLNYTLAVRPVFYLNSDEQYISGDGTLDNPIMLDAPKIPIGEYIQNANPAGYNSTMEGGLYRFQGTTANNYICFGTSDKDTCIGNTDVYMYRIIGINSSGQLKLIKREALNTAYYWYNSYSSNITWPNSDLFKGLNGKSGGTYSNLFIGNSTYMPSGWSDKIADTSWKYGDNTNVNQTASALYNTENGWTATTTAKIGLMYAHDYAYGMSGGNNCSSSGAYSTCKTSWMFITNSDSGAPDTYEWTMSRYGSLSDRYDAWAVGSNGYFYNSSLHGTNAVRPVFYLKSSVNFIGGTGTASDPFIVN